RNGIGLISKTGEILIPAEYDYIEPLRFNPLHHVCGKGYTSFSYLNFTWKVYKNDQGSGVIKTDGTEILPVKYNYIIPIFWNHIDDTLYDPEWILIDSNGLPIINAPEGALNNLNFSSSIFERHFSYKKPDPILLFYAQDGIEKLALYDIHNNLFLPPADDYEIVQNGFISRNDDTYSLIDITGKTIMKSRKLRLTNRQVLPSPDW